MMETPNKGIIHIPGGTEQDIIRHHQAIQNIMRFKTYELFISENLLFSDHGWLQVTDTM